MNLTGHQSCCLWPRRILLRVANALGDSGFYFNLFQLLNALGTELNFVIIATDVNIILIFSLSFSCLSR